MAQVSRADLLRLFLDIDSKQQELKDYAEFFGYEKLSEKIELKLPKLDLGFLAKEEQKKEPLPEIATSNVDFSYFVLESIEEQPVEQDKVEKVKKEIAWLDEPEEHEIPEELKNKTQPKKSRLLFDWQGLKERLQEALIAHKKRNQIDIKLVIKKISQIKLLRTLPRRFKKSQASNIRLVTDYTSQHLRPVFHDFTELSEKIKLLFGEHYLKQKKLTKYQDSLTDLLRAHREERALSYLQGTRAVIVISDLGLYLPNDDVLNQWLTFAKIAHAYSCQPIAILPVPAHYLDARVTTAFDCICMESGGAITTKYEPDLEKRQKAIEKDQEIAKETLLTALATAPNVGLALLRAVRDVFGAEKCSVAAEVLAWTHPDVSSGSTWIYIKQERQADYLKLLREKLEPSEKKGIRKAFVDYDYYSHSKEDFIYELSLFDVACGFSDELSKYCVVEHRNLARRLNKDPNAARNLFVKQQLERHALESLFLNEYKHQEEKSNYATVMTAKLRLQGKDTNKPLEPWLDEDIFSYMMQAKPELDSPVDKLRLLEFPDHLLLTGDHGTDKTQDTLLQKGNLVTSISCKEKVFFAKIHYKNNKSEEHLIWLDKQLPYRFDKEDLRELVLEFHSSDKEKLACHFEKKVKPEEAEAISSNSNGTSILTVPKGSRYYRYPSIKRQKGNSEEIKCRAFWYPENPLRVGELGKLPKPVWADDVGTDACGLYADLVVRNITQRFRWIEPGEFWMGSPEGEEDREDDSEDLHKVRLTKGFWLADTTCTQALWKAVMGENPSHFKSDDLPVEQVSWDDAKSFMEKLNSLVQGLQLRLPTEAEWEYACRAGTDTPFAYGKEADSKLMNFGRNLKRTVPVNDLFQNSWGLFQMHGNVYEWCEDWYGKYKTKGEITVDPRGPDTGTDRVLRGGSWIGLVWHCRSACREWLDPAYGDERYGFRLVSGHQEKTE